MGLLALLDLTEIAFPSPAFFVPLGSLVLLLSRRPTRRYCSIYADTRKNGCSRMSWEMALLLPHRQIAPVLMP